MNSNLWIALAAASVAAAVFVMFDLTPFDSSTEATARRLMPPPTAPRQPVASAPAPLPVADALSGVITFAQGDVRVDGAPLDLDKLITAGAEIVVKKGMVAVQFGDGSGFSVGESSRLRVRAFDATRVALDIEGEVSVEVSKRGIDQVFAVLAGDRTVVVRGTAFKVSNHAGRLDVVCTHGHVVVSDASGKVDVHAGQAVRLQVGESLGVLRSKEVQRLDDELAQQQVHVPLLPGWTDASSALTTSSTLQVEGEEGSLVHIDGVSAGTGSFFVRMMPGRHHVESKDTEGEWVELASGRRAKAALGTAPEIVAAVAKRQTPRNGSATGRAQRKRQLAKALKRTSRVRQCLRPLAKQGMVEGSFIELDIGVNPEGSFGHINIVASNMSSSVERCIRNAVDVLSLPAGARATIRHRLEF